ncbi:UvrD-helicase domain-containing protein [Neobacillus sp. GCM10023253]|uniref:UvrD-helicase domain-containing protein n=1 Tax=Neobacillus sp. GCM10023253 TaxID=3252644 RepID=UPI00361BE552
MKVLALHNFYKTVPREKEQDVNERISYLIRVLREYHNNFDAIPTGLGFKRVESISQRIYKFKVHGDRVLCSKAEYLHPNIEKEYKDSLILLEYCNHDSQIKVAKRRDFAKQITKGELLPEEAIIITEADKKEHILDYTLNAPTTIIKNIDVDNEQLVNIFGEEGNFYYLDPEQKSLVNNIDKGQFVFGSAGSGKTTISVYKIIQFLESKRESPESKIAYFTYSNKLKEQTKTLFEKMAKEIYGFERKDFQDKVEFQTVEEYLEQHNPLAGKIVTYEKFKEWYESQNNLSRFDPTGLWKERRGIFQGMIGPSWQNSFELPTRNFHKDTLNYLKQKNYIEWNYQTFRLSVELNKICSSIQAEFGSSEPFRNNVISEYNKQIASKKELSEDEYYHLKDRDSLYYGEERNKVVTIFKRFDTYMESLKGKGFYEEGKIVRSALQNVFPTYDYIIIDEVQDLTEIQVYYLYQLLKSKYNVFVCGDFHQTINPTFFHVGRIESIFRFLGGIDNYSTGKLEKNYRSSKNIVDFANEISLLRKESIATNEELNYTEKPLRGETRNPYLFRGDKALLWDYVKDKSYLYIVVGNERTKTELIKSFPDLESRIMTVSEIKGIENKYIITYNIFSDNNKQWTDIFAKLNSPTKLKSEVYRYYFNLAYVSITRARDGLGMIEDDLPETASNWLKEKVDVITKFDIQQLGLQEQSSSGDMLENAFHLEQGENFDQAIATYKTVINSENLDLIKAAEKGIKRCQLKKDCKLTKDYAFCGKQLLELKEYDEAIPYLQRGKDAKALLKAILLSNYVERYDLNKEMEGLETNPLKILIEMNDERLTKRFILNEIDPFKHQYHELVRKSGKVVVLSAKS